MVRVVGAPYDVGHVSPIHPIEATDYNFHTSAEVSMKLGEGIDDRRRAPKEGLDESAIDFPQTPEHV